MIDVFSDKSKWLQFAQEQNDNASSSATQLNGSQSYTLAAFHLAAGIPIPKSVLLDTKRASGKFVSTHFKGLRQLYESNIESNFWLPGIIDKCSELASTYSIDFDSTMKKLIEITEKNGRTPSAKIPSSQEPATIQHYEDGEIQI